MSSRRTADVVVIGAGLAGLAAAVALSGAGADVLLLERKGYVGGRAYSYPHPALEEVIDSQHVMLGCCTNLIDLCARAGAANHIRWYDNITFLEPATAEKQPRRSDIGPSFLPAPAHSSLSFARAKMLGPSDKAAIANGLLEFMRGYPQCDRESFAEWLRRTEQTDRAVRHFWEPVIVGALNDSFERCSTRYAGQVFYESFLKSPEGGKLGIPTQPLSEFYAALAKLAEAQGAEVLLRRNVERIERYDGKWRVTSQDGEQFTANKLLLALPFEQTAKMLATVEDAGEHISQVKESLRNFVHAPITTVHLWFDREVTDLDHAALLDTRIQWMFNKTQIRRHESSASVERGHYLELVISASFSELQMPREQILQPALAELARFFPSVKAARLIKSGLLKEARATFSVTPGLDEHRPPQDFGERGLFLAGDWTQTGWPSTMEGAVRSGRLAAEAVRGTSSTSFLTNDLQAKGLMRLVPTECG